MSGPGDQKMWGGRFDRPPDASFYEFERSWHFDRRLLPQELALDRAWARAIAAAGILTDEEGQQIVAALDEIELRAQSDAAWLDNSKAEDVHHFAETALIEKLGSARRKAPHRPQPQRNGCDRVSHVCEGCGPRCPRRSCVAPSRHCRPGRAKSRHPHARNDAYATRSTLASFALAARAR